MSRKTGAKGLDKHPPQTWRERAIANFRKVGFVYVGHDIERDLRTYLEELADECDRAQRLLERQVSGTVMRYDETALDAHEEPVELVVSSSTAPKRAAEILRRLAKQRSLAEIFPEQLGHRPNGERPFWVAVDCLLRGTDHRAIAKSWGFTSPATVRKYVRTYAESARLAFGDEGTWSAEQRATLRQRVELERSRRARRT